MDDERIGIHKYSCKYPKCRSRYYNSIRREDYHNKRFFRFPRTGARALAWKDVCNLEHDANTKHFYLCEDHFAHKDFMNYTKHRLVPGAIPLRPEEHPVDITDLDYVSGISHSAGESHVKYRSFLFESTDTTVTASVDNPHEDYTFLSHNEEIQADTSSSSIAPDSNGSPTLNIHRTISLNLLKLKNFLHNEKHILQKLFSLYKEGKFFCINQQLDDVSNEFLRHHLQYVSTVNKWTDADYYQALSFYCRSEKLYKYLSSVFRLPSAKKLKLVLSHIPFNTGIIKPLINQMKMDVGKMNRGNQTCVLLMDEIMLSYGITYDETHQHMCGYEDQAHLGRFAKAADRALVLMVRGLRRNWAQVVSYYFSRGPLTDVNLQNIIVTTVKHLQTLGLNVVAFVCKQTVTNLKALSLLTTRTETGSDSFYFAVNAKRINVIFDVRHLLNDTRRALMKCEITFDETGKRAKFEHIQSVYNLDQSKRIYKQLYKLNDEYFETGESNDKADIVAARHLLSYKVATSIETFILWGDLPQEAMHTAEFVEIMDTLFDSLNGSERDPTDNKKYRCMLSKNSPHPTLWSALLNQLNEWKLTDLESQRDVTDQYFFVQGWQITIESILYIWNQMINRSYFNYLSLRRFNLEPLEDLLERITRYGTDDKNPTCHQFIAALKAEILNRNDNPWTGDDYYNLTSLRTFFLIQEDFNGLENEETYFDDLNFDVIHHLEFHEQVAYLSGYLLQKVDIPDCTTCRSNLLAEWVINNSEVDSREKYDDDSMYSIYASDAVVRIADRILYLLRGFLFSQGNQSNLENGFKVLYKHEYESFKFCNAHNCNEEFVKLCIKLGIYKFVCDFNNKFQIN